MASLLPPNASPLELAMEQALARLSDVPVPLTVLWNPDACPVELLPMLAWSLSVDWWDDEWTEQQKRSVIKASIAVHRKKGTPWAVEYGLSVLGFPATVSEWFQYDGERGCFRVWLEPGTRVTERDGRNIASLIRAYKNTRSHLDAVVLPLPVGNQTRLAGAGRVPLRLSGGLHYEPQAITGTARTVGVGRMLPGIGGRPAVPAGMYAHGAAAVIGAGRILQPIRGTYHE